MKKVKFFIVLCILGLVTRFNVYAQTYEGNFMEDYLTALDNLFSGLDETKINTGILMDRSLPLIDLTGFNATDTSQALNAIDWVNSYMQINYAHLDPEDFFLDTNIIRNFPLREITDNEIPFGILLFDYNTISDEAFINGYINVDTVNNLISDVSGPGINPYSLKTCFAVTPLATSLYVGSYTFNISEDLLFSNKITDFDNISIDFGDGYGIQNLYLGAYYMVNYMLPGTKKISVIAEKDGIYYYSYSTIDVIEDSESKSGINPDFGPDDFYDATSNITAEYAYWYACNNESKQIRKPYLIVSGYDPNDNNRFEDEEDEENKVNLYTVANKDGYLEKLREDGYDIILYRSKNSLESIIDNAMNLVEFINKINNEKTSDNELIVVGASMGGLIVRYALTYMEYNGIDHQAKLFISMDSPQLGANVPLGFQHMFHGLVEVLKDLFPLWIDFDEEVNTKMLDGVAAKQMLLYHYTETGDLKAKQSSVRTNYLTQLDSLGNFPENCRTIGVSQGSGISESQGFAPGALLIQKDPSTYAGVPGVFSNMRLEFKVRAVPNQSFAEVFRMKVSWKICFKVPTPWGMETICNWNPPGFPEAIIVKAVNNTKPYDNAPGSVQGFHNLGVLKADESSIMGFTDMDEIITWLEDQGYFWTEDHNDCFIPTFSSLALNTADPSINAKEYLGLKVDEGVVVELNDNTYFNFEGTSTSLFDVMYIENINDSHIYHPDTKEGAFSTEMLDFMTQEASPDDLFIENREFTSGQAKMFEARNTITLGENIDDIYENNGEVIVNNGAKLTLNANNSITLKPGFSAFAGSEVNITPSAPWYCANKSIVTTQTPKYITQPVLEVKSKEEVKGKSSELYDLVQEFSKPIIVYPNPTQDILYISSNKAVNKLKLFDSQGILLNNKNFERKTVLNISNLSAGIYILEIEQENGVNIVERIIKQ